MIKGADFLLLFLLGDRLNVYFAQSWQNSFFLCCSIEAFSGDSAPGLRAMAYCGSRRLISAVGRFHILGRMRIFLPWPAETRAVNSPLSASSNSFRVNLMFSRVPGIRNSINSPGLI